MIQVQMSPLVDALRPPNDPLRAQIKNLAELQAQVTDDQRRSAIIAAHQPGADPALRVALAAARERVIRLNVWAENVVLALFAIQSLENDAWVQVVNRRDQKLNVLETHVGGESPRQSFAVAHDTTMYFLARYSTGIIDYPSEDGILGRINVADEVNRDLIRSWDNKINDNLDPLITAAIGSFTSGTTYVRDSRFVSATLPTANNLTNTDEAGFTFEIFKDIVEHFDLLPGKSLRLIRLNPTEMRDTWAWQDRVSGPSGGGSEDARELVTTRIKEGLIETGRPTGTILGRNVTYLLDPTYAKKKLQCFSQEPVGIFYHKPNLDRVVDFDEHAMQVMGKGENIVGVQKSGYWLAQIVGPDATNVLEITFETG